MSYPYYDQVQRAHTELKTEGKIAPRTNQEEVEQDKGLITRRAAWYVFSEQDSNIGLLEKTSGNQSMGYSVDWNVDKSTGIGYDVVTDQEASGGLREAVPVNGGPSAPSQDNIDRWREPTAELAQVEDDGGSNPEPPEPPPVNDEKLDDIIELINNLSDQSAQETASIIAKSDENTDRIIAELGRIVDDAEETLRKFLVIWIARQNEDEEEDLPDEDDDGPSSQLILLLLRALGEKVAKKKGKSKR